MPTIVAVKHTKHANRQGQGMDLSSQRQEMQSPKITDTPIPSVVDGKFNAQQFFSGLFSFLSPDAIRDYMLEIGFDPYFDKNDNLYIGKKVDATVISYAGKNILGGFDFHFAFVRFNDGEEREVILAFENEDNPIKIGDSICGFAGYNMLNKEEYFKTSITRNLDMKCIYNISNTSPKKFFKKSSHFLTYIAFLLKLT